MTLDWTSKLAHAQLGTDVKNWLTGSTYFGESRRTTAPKENQKKNSERRRFLLSFILEIADCNRPPRSQNGTIKRIELTERISGAHPQQKCSVV